jgi:thiol-disulfide isomerase/thioredoxin
VGKIGDPAGSLDGLKYVKGGPVKIEAGKVYVVEFWATWCPPCLKSIPHLTEVAHKYKDKNVQIVGISTEPMNDVKPFVEKQGDKMDYVVAIDPSENVSKAYMEAYGCNGIPTAFIVDAGGKVAWFGHPMGDMEKVLDEVIAGKFDAAGYSARKAEEDAKFEANVKTYNAYFEKIRGGGTMDEARAIVDKWVDEAPADALNAMSWAILTEVEEAKRDKEFALRAAEKANSLLEGKDAATLDTLALALFQNGKAAEAIAAQEKAVGLIKGNEEMLADMNKRLEEYKSAAKI